MGSAEVGSGAGVMPPVPKLTPGRMVYQFCKENGICVKCHHREAKETNVVCARCQQTIQRGSRKWKDDYKKKNGVSYDTQKYREQVKRKKEAKQ